MLRELFGLLSLVAGVSPAEPRSTRSKRTSIPLTAPLQLEELERRLMLNGDTMLWIAGPNGTDFNWTTNGNWKVIAGPDLNQNKAPGGSDIAVFDPSQTGGKDSKCVYNPTVAIGDLAGLTVASGYDQSIDFLKDLGVSGSGNVSISNGRLFTDANSNPLPSLGFNTTGNITWAGGSIELFTTFGSANNKPTVTFSGTADKTLKAKMYNYGTLTWTGGNLLFNSTGGTNNAQFVNKDVGTFTIQTDANVSADVGSPSFTNEGTFKKTAGIQTNGTSFAPTFTNSGTVTLSSGYINFTSDMTQTAGTFTLSGGTFNTTRTLGLQGGILTGTGTIGGSINNSGGNLTAGLNSQGTLNLSGTYTQGANGTMTVNFTSAGGFGVFNVQGSGGATLGGHLVENRNGYMPTIGTFDFLLATTFNNTDFADFNAGMNDTWQTGVPPQTYTFATGTHPSGGGVAYYLKVQGAT